MYGLHLIICSPDHRYAMLFYLSSERLLRIYPKAVENVQHVLVDEVSDLQDYGQQARCAHTRQLSSFKIPTQCNTRW